MGGACDSTVHGPEASFQVEEFFFFFSLMLHLVTPVHFLPRIFKKWLSGEDDKKERQKDIGRER